MLDDNTLKDQTLDNQEVKNSSLDAVEAIEEIVANTAEKAVQEEKQVAIDYSNLNLNELVEKLTKLIKESNVLAIKDNVNAIKNAFNDRFSKLLAEKKAAFLATGGASIDFKFDSPVKVAFNELMRTYKKQQQAYFKERDNQLKQNLIARNDIIDALKELIEKGDGKTMYKSFRALDDRWKSIGPVPRATYNDTWKIYHHHVERFYDLLHISNDLRDLDFKHNLEEKLKLIAKVNQLAALEDVNEAFNELQHLHKAWKEDIGPVAREHREAIWKQFSEATKIIHDKKHEHYKVLRQQYEANIQKKKEVITQIADFDTSSNTSHADWQNSIKKINELRDAFFKIGKVPRSKNEEIWNLFKEATKKFNKSKNDYYKTIKAYQQENLTKKRVLIQRAEDLKESEDWEMTTAVMKQLQSEWKNIGHVPKPISDKIWKQFKAACNYYFDRLHAVQDEGKQTEMEVYNKKKTLLETVKKQFEASTEFTLDTIKETISNWRSLGKVPYNVRYIDSKFNKVIDAAFSKLSIPKATSEMLKFQNNIDSYLAQNDIKKLENEQFYLRKKIDELVREIQLLENNINFFSNTKSDNPLLLNARKNIETQKENLSLLKDKLSYIRSLDF